MNVIIIFFFCPFCLWWVEWAVDDYTIRNAAWVCVSVYVMVGLRIGFIPYKQMKGNLWVWMWTWTKQTQHFHFTLSSHDRCTLNNNNNCRRATSHGNFFWSSPFDLVRAICITEQGLVQKQLFVRHRSERCMTTANESHIKPVRRVFRFILKLLNFGIFFRFCGKNMAQNNWFSLTLVRTQNDCDSF